MNVTFLAGIGSRVAIIRVLPGTDVIEGVLDACKRLGFKTGAITSCIGSLQKASYLVAVPVQNRIGAGYGDPEVLDGPLELLSAQGFIGQDEEGNLFVHMHGLISDRDGNVRGGHLIRGRNPVLITCEIMISELEGGCLFRMYDPRVEMEVFMPSGNH